MIKDMWHWVRCQIGAHSWMHFKAGVIRRLGGTRHHFKAYRLCIDCSMKCTE